ncbi:MAG: SpoIIIAH-like family protein [Clostridia bacterium]
MKNFKKNQVVIFVIALMFITAGYLNFANQNRENNLLPTSSLADSEQMAAIGDAKLVSAEEATQNQETNTINNELVNEQKNNLKNEENKQTNITNNQPIQEDSYFAQSRLDRDNMYSQMLENYQKILETSNLTSEEKTNAQNEIKRINNEKNAIMIAENLIKTKGFLDVVIFVNNTNVTAVVKTESLNEQSIAQIQNIITRELNVKANKINISNKK